MNNLNLGSLNIGVLVDLQNATRQLTTLRNNVETTETATGDLSQEFNTLRTSISRVDFESVTNKLDKLGNTMSLKVTAPLTALGVAMFKMAADFDETLNKVNVTFEDSSKEVIAWADTSITAMGMAKSTALEMTAVYGDMGKAMGLSMEQTQAYATSLTQLAGDLASFKNISHEQARTALTGIYTGETESLKQLGYVMTDVNLQQFAISQGIKKTTQEMSQAEKVQLRYNFIMNASKDAQGDFARTSDGASNQVRILQESLKELSIAFGEELVPIITPLITRLTELVQGFGDLNTVQKESIVKMGLLLVAIGPVSKALAGLGDAIIAIKAGMAMFSAFAGSVGVATGALGIFVGSIGLVIADLTKLITTGKKAKDVMADLESHAGNTKGMTWGDSDELDQHTKDLIEYTQAHDDLVLSIQQLEAQQTALSSAMGNAEYGTSEWLRLRGELDNTNKSLEDTYVKYNNLKGFMEGYYYTVDAGLAVGNKHIEQLNANTKEVEKKTKADAEMAKQIEEGVILSQEGIQYLQASANSYMELAQQQELSKREVDELLALERMLVEVFGNEVIIRNNLGKGVGVNIKAMNDEAIANIDLSNAKIKAVNVMGSANATHVRNQIDATKVIIDLLEKEIAMYGERDRNSMNTDEWARYQDKLNYKKRLEQEIADMSFIPEIATAGKSYNSSYNKDYENFTSVEKEKQKTWQELQQERIDAMEQEVENRKYYNNLTLEEEYKLYTEIKKVAEFSAEEQERITKELFRIKQQMLADETEEVRKNCDEQIRLRQEVLDKDIEKIDAGLKEELAKLQGELDQLDYEAEQARIATQKAQKQQAIDDAKMRLSQAVTDEERYKASQDLNKAELDYEKFMNDLKIKEEKRRIQEEMKLAREKAEAQKKELQAQYDGDVLMYELARELKLEALEKQHEEEFKLMQGKQTDFGIVETNITQAMKDEFSKRSTLLAEAVKRDIAELQKVGNAKTNAYGMFQKGASIASSMLFAPKPIIPSVNQVMDAYKGDAYNDNKTINITMNNTVRSDNDVNHIVRQVKNTMSNDVRQYRANKGGGRN